MEYIDLRQVGREGTRPQKLLSGAADNTAIQKYITNLNYRENTMGVLTVIDIFLRLV